MIEIDVVHLFLLFLGAACFGGVVTLVVAASMLSSGHGRKEEQEDRGWLGEIRGE